MDFQHELGWKASKECNFFDDLLKIQFAIPTGIWIFLLRFLTVLRYWLKVCEDWLMGVNWEASGQEGEE